jgi:hypothetical protein
MQKGTGGSEVKRLSAQDERRAICHSDRSTNTVDVEGFAYWISRDRSTNSDDVNTEECSK